jgi:hypothetical protein
LPGNVVSGEDFSRKNGFFLLDSVDVTQLLQEKNSLLDKVKCQPLVCLVIL